MILFQTFLVFDNWQFWRVLDTLQSVSQVGLSEFFLMMKLELWGFRRKTTEAKCPSHHILSKVHAIYMKYRWWCWPWSPGCSGACQDSPLKFSLWPHFHTVLYGRKSSMWSPHLRCEKLCSSLREKAGFLPKWILSETFIKLCRPLQEASRFCPWSTKYQ